MYRTFCSDLWKLGRDYDFPSRDVIRNSMVDLGQLANSVLGCKEKWSLDGLCQHLVSYRKRSAILVTKKQTLPCPLFLFCHPEVALDIWWSLSFGSVPCPNYRKMLIVFFSSWKTRTSLFLKFTFFARCSFEADCDEVGTAYGVCTSRHRGHAGPPPPRPVLGVGGPLANRKGGLALHCHVTVSSDHHVMWWWGSLGLNTESAFTCWQSPSQPKGVGFFG